MATLFAITLALNALLLFLAQPMIARMLLPYLGGTPAVWNTCMVFFQTALLAGYAYSHAATTRLGVRRHTVPHLALLLAAAFVFPIEISQASVQALSGGTPPAYWLLRSLLLTAGLPFFMLATGAPLLQRWFSTTNHKAGNDPYFLYSASNLGSLIGLLSYPLLLEPNLRLREQSRLWAAGYMVLVVLISLCAIARWRAGKSPDDKSEEAPAHGMLEDERGQEAEGLITWSRRLRWALLSFVPSSLMLGATAYLSTDVSPIPLLWTLPLALYLLTFILAFARRPFPPLGPIVKRMPLLALIVVLQILTRWSLPAWSSVGLHLLFLFMAAFVCHSRLAADRPSAAHLTGFYLWLSVGGMLGGMFNSLLAPVIFNTVAEYPIVIVLALLLRPRMDERMDERPERARDRWLDLALPAGVGALTVALGVFPARWGIPAAVVWVISLLLPSVVCYTFLKHPARFALAIGAIMLGDSFNSQFRAGETLRQERSFFGALRVARSADGEFIQLFHGTTKHGRQYRQPDRRCEPLSYYHRRGPLGDALEAFYERPASPNVAVIGLGTGAMACYAAAGQEWTFYEIDPAVISIARNRDYFSYLDCAGAPVKIALGDARLRLRDAPDGSYGLIALDAFSSDAIPVHLLTREALDLYLSKLAPGGRLLFHISNRFLNLRPALADLAKSANLVCFAVEYDRRKQSAEGGSGLDPSSWLAVARSAEDLGALASHPRWRKLEGQAQAGVWTDDYSNVLGALRWK